MDTNKNKNSVTKKVGEGFKFNWNKILSWIAIAVPIILFLSAGYWILQLPSKYSKKVDSRYVLSEHDFDKGSEALSYYSIDSFNVYHQDVYYEISLDGKVILFKQIGEKDDKLKINCDITIDSSQRPPIILVNVIDTIGFDLLINEYFSNRRILNSDYDLNKNKKEKPIADLTKAISSSYIRSSNLDSLTYRNKLASLIVRQISNKKPSSYYVINRSNNVINDVGKSDYDNYSKLTKQPYPVFLADTSNNLFAFPAYVLYWIAFLSFIALIASLFLYDKMLKKLDDGSKKNTSDLKQKTDNEETDEDGNVIMKEVSQADYDILQELKVIKDKDTFIQTLNYFENVKPVLNDLGKVEVLNKLKSLLIDNNEGKVVGNLLEYFYKAPEFKDVKNSTNTIKTNFKNFINDRNKKVVEYKKLEKIVENLKTSEIGNSKLIKELKSKNKKSLLVEKNLEKELKKVKDQNSELKKESDKILNGFGRVETLDDIEQLIIGRFYNNEKIKRHLSMVQGQLKDYNKLNEFTVSNTSSDSPGALLESFKEILSHYKEEDDLTQKVNAIVPDLMNLFKIDAAEVKQYLIDGKDLERRINEFKNTIVKDKNQKKGEKGIQKIIDVFQYSENVFEFTESLLTEKFDLNIKEFETYKKNALKSILGIQVFRRFYKGVKDRSESKLSQISEIVMEIREQEEFKGYGMTNEEYSQQVSPLLELFEENNNNISKIKELNVLLSDRKEYLIKLYERFKDFRNNLYSLLVDTESGDANEKARVYFINNLFKISFHSFYYLMYNFSDNVNANREAIAGNKEIILKEKIISELSHNYNVYSDDSRKVGVVPRFIFEEAKRVGVNDLEDVLIDNFYIPSEKFK